MNTNIVILAGNLTRNPELNHTNTGKAVCNFGIAVNERWKSADGTMKEEVYFGECTAWAATGEAIARHFVKGQAIFIEGKLRLETWASEGKKQSKTRINVERFSFVGAKGDKADKPRDATPLATAGKGIAGTGQAPGMFNAAELDAAMGGDARAVADAQAHGGSDFDDSPPF